MAETHHSEFLRQLRDALAHLYDYAYLQRHPLADQLVPPQATATRTRAQELRRILLNAIEALNPGDNTPIRAAERRAHAILFGLYVEGRDRREMAASLNISGRQLRRDRAAAYEALASILQDQLLTLEPPPPPPSAEPLRSESERLAQQKEPVDLAELVEGLIPLLDPLARQRDINLVSQMAPDLPKPWANRILIRQSLIGLASHALASLPLARLAFDAHAVEGGTQLGLRLKYHSNTLQPAGHFPSLDPLLKSVETLVSALGSRLSQEQLSQDEEAIWLLLPKGVERVVLVVDDNEDLFALFQRYVAGEAQKEFPPAAGGSGGVEVTRGSGGQFPPAAGGLGGVEVTRGSGGQFPPAAGGLGGVPQPYRLIHAPSVDEALALLTSTRPDMIILDLMLPNRDGWELLQLLHANPDTAKIPVAVCSILDDPELAFSWGAQFYLKKPVGSLELLQVLAGALG